MKIKKFNKVLTLNKSTVSNLDSDQMNAAKGGYWITGFEWTCHSWCDCNTNWYHCPSNKTYICP